MLAVSPSFPLYSSCTALKRTPVEAVMLTGGTSKQESRDIHERLTSLANRKVGLTDKEIKLCYVTVSITFPLLVFSRIQTVALVARENCEKQAFHGNVREIEQRPQIRCITKNVYLQLNSKGRFSSYCHR